MNSQAIDILLFAVKLGIVFFVVLTLAAYLVFAERRILAWIQDRKGPNRVGPWGLLQPLADLIKLLTKEDFRPVGADRWLFYLAPAMAAVPAIMTFAVIPFGAPLKLLGREVPVEMAGEDPVEGVIGDGETQSVTNQSHPLGQTRLGNRSHRWALIDPDNESAQVSCQEPGAARHVKCAGGW